MSWVARFLRTMAKLRFKILGLATVKDIPTEKFGALIKKLGSVGWQPTSQYSGFDAWIDYGCIRLRKGMTTLKFEWDNWTEGSVAGPRRVIEAIAAENNFTVTYAWRWSEYDNANRDI